MTAYDLSTIEKYLQHLKESVYNKLTVKNYASDVRNFYSFFRNYFPKFTLNEISINVIKQYEKHLRDYQASESTIRRRIASLKSFFRWAFIAKIVTNNPFLSDLSEVKNKKFINQPSIQTQKIGIDKPENFQLKIENIEQKAVILISNLFKTKEIKNSRQTLWKYFSIITTSFITCCLVIFITIKYSIPYFEKTPQLDGTILGASAPNILSFQGRLTDENGIPETGLTDMRFQIYTVASEGTSVWDSGVCSINPDGDGVFSTVLGSTCGSPISESVFANNTTTYLGITAGTDSEMTPRQRIASSAYALNADTLDGFDSSQSPGANNVAVLDASGNLVFGVSGPQITSSSGTFTISGSALTIQTTTGDLLLSPTENTLITSGNVGIGTTNPTYRLHVSGDTYSSNIKLPYGGTIGDYRGNYAKIGFNDSLKFYVYNSNEAMRIIQGGLIGIGTTAPTHKLELADHTTTAGGMAFGTDVELYRSSANNLTLASGDNFNLTASTNLIFGGTTSLGEATSAIDSGGYFVGVFDEFDNSASTNVQGVLNDLDLALTSGGAGSMWTLASGVIYPTTVTNDFALGGTTLAASMFGLDEDSGNFYFGYDNSVNPTLLFEATDADAGSFGFNTNDAFYFSDANVGIGTTNPLSTLHVNGSMRIADGSYIYISGASTSHYITHNFATDAMDLRTYNFMNFGFSSGSGKFAFESGNVGIGTTNPQYLTHIYKNDAVTNTTTTLLSLEHQSTGAVADQFGVALDLYVERISGGVDYSRVEAYQDLISSQHITLGTSGNRYLDISNSITWINNKLITGTAWNNGISAVNALNVYGATAIGTGYVGATAPSNGLIVQGNVGIGTTTANTALTINGNIQFTNAADRTISVAALQAVDGVGKSLTILAGGGLSNGNGGDLNLKGGTGGTGSNYSGGDVYIEGGQPGNAGPGGDLFIGKQTFTGNTVGGNVFIYGQNSGSWGSATGGDITLLGGTTNYSAGIGGNISITAGRGGSDADGGIITLLTGAGGSSTGNSGNLVMGTGTYTSGSFGTLSFNQGINSRLFINSIGNVGIGTTAPGASLEIAGNSSNEIRLYSSGTVAPPKLHFRGINYDSNIYQDSLGNIAFDTETANQMVTFENGGFVGIGITNPTSTLDVNGDIYTSSGISTYRTAVTDGTIEAIKFCTGDGETNCVTDFSSLSSGASIWTDSGTYIYPTNGEVIGNSASAGANKVSGLYLTDSAPFTFGTDNDVSFSFSGSELSVTQGNNDINFDANTFFIDGFTNNVGIGTTNPTVSMEIVGDLSLSGADRTITLGGIAAGSIIQSGRSITFINNYNMASSDSWYTSFKHSSSGIETMRLATSVGFGKLGIGIIGTSVGITPQYALDVNASRNAGNITTVGRFLVQNAGGLGVGQDGDGSRIVLSGETETDKTYEDIGGIAGSFEDATAGTTDGTLHFYTTSESILTERMRLTSLGLLGIGTTTPGAKLDILQTTPNTVLFNAQSIESGYSGQKTFVNTYGALASQLLNVSNNIAYAVIMAGDTYGRIGFGLNNGTPFLGLGPGTTNRDTWFYRRNGDLTFEFGITPEEKVRITNTGSMGIGTTGPDAKIDILTTSGEQLRLTYTDDSIYTGFSVDSAGDLYINATGNNIALQSGDNLILTSNTDLIIGNTYIGEATSAIDSGGYFVGVFDEFDNSASTNVQGVLNDLDLALTSGGAGSMWTLASGVIYPTTVTNDFALGGTTLAASMFGLDEDSGNFYFGYDNSVNPTLLFEATDADAGSFGFNTNDAFYFSDANVGIGTTSPGNNLQVVGDFRAGLAGTNRYTSISSIGILTARYDDNDIKNVLNLENRDTGIGNEGVNVLFNLERIGGTTGLNAGRIVVQKEQAWTSTTSTQDSYMSFSTRLDGSLTEWLRINSSGNVGIGTTNPTYKLQINNPGAGLIGTMAVDAEHYTGYAWLRSGSMKWSLINNEWASEGTDSLVFYGSGLVKIASLTQLGNFSTIGSILSTGTSNNYFMGNVGIGTTAPTSLLSLYSTSTSTSFTGFGLDWQPGSATTTTGDLFKINIGSNGTASSLFNVTDNTSSLFKVTEAQITSAVPHAFTSSGDVSMAYNLNFTNETSSYIRTSAPLYLEVGDNYESNSLTLRTYNAGDIIFDAGDASGDTGTIKLYDSYIKGATVTTPIAFSDASADINNYRSNFTDETLIGAINETYAAVGGGGGGLWTLASGVIYPTTVTNDFALGGTTLAASMFGLDEDSGNFYFGYDNSVNPTLLFEATDADAGSFGFNTNDAFFFSNANVGIGTTNPNSNLHIYSNSLTSTSLKIENTGANGYTGADITLISPNTSRGAGIITQLGSSSTSWFFGNPYSIGDNFVINRYTTGAVANPNGNNLLLINSTGNVGIGNTNPTHKLELADHTTTAGGMAFGTDVELYRSSANNLTLASGDNFNLTASTNLIFGGTTSLGEATSAIDSGGYFVGVFDEFDNSASTNVQGVLNDLDLALTSGGAGSMWTLASGVIYPTTVTNDFALGGTTLAASMFGLDEDSGNFYFGYDNSVNPTLLFEATDADAGSFGFNTNDAFFFSDAKVGVNITNPYYRFHSYETSTIAAESKTAIYGQTVSTLGAGETGTSGYAKYGLWGESEVAVTDAGTTTSPHFAGIYGLATILSNHLGTVNILKGSRILTSIQSGAAGTASNVYGVSIETYSPGANTTTISNYKALNINSTNYSGQTTPVNSYGVYIENITGSSLAYSIYTNTGDVSIGDDLLLRNDNDRIQVGASGDLDLYHSGTNSFITNATGYLDIQSTNNTVFSVGNVGIGTTAPSSLLSLYSTSTSTSFTGFGLNWQPGSTTTLTGDLFNINIGSSGNASSLFNVTDNTSSLFKVTETTITSTLPHSFTASGDTSMAYDLIMTNQTASSIQSYGPMTIEAGESFENNDLTLKAYGTGRVLISGSGLALETSQNFILDSNDSGDTYLTHDATNDRISYYVDNTEMFRMDAGGNSSNGAISTTLTDLAETYPTYDDKLTTGDLVMIDPEATSKTVSLVKRAEFIGRDSLIGAVSTAPGFILGGGSFSEDFCQEVRKEGINQAISDYQHELENIKNEDTIVSEANTSEKIEAKKEAAKSCLAPQKVMVALSGRVPLNVDLVNGDINPGDPLTVSPSIGKAMKANTSGMIVGRALEKVTKKDYDAGKKTVMAIIQVNYWQPSTAVITTQNLITTDLSSSQIDNLDITKELHVLGKTVLNETSILNKLTIAGTLTIDDNKINTIGTLQVQSLNMSNTEFQGAKIVMTTDGDMKILGTLEVGKITGSSEMRDSLIFAGGQTEYKVQMNWETSPKVIQITPTWNTSFWITDLNEHGFTVHVNTPATEIKEIYWVAIW